MKRLSLLAILFLAVRCMPQHSGSLGTDAQASNAPFTAESLQSFQTTVYAFGQMQGCVACHDTNVNPMWMNPDLPTAYSFARPLLNLTDPENSIFATYVSNGHCSVAACSDPNNKAVMQDLLLQWATVEQNSNPNAPPITSGLPLSNPPYRTLTMPLPATIPLITAGTPAVVRFDLSQMSPAVPALNGAILEVSIAYYNSLNTTYKVFNPRLVGSTAQVTLTGLHVYTRAAAGAGLGTEDINQGLAWSELALTAPVQAAPAPMPAGPMTSVGVLTTISLGVGSHSASDVITIGFAGISN